MEKNGRNKIVLSLGLNTALALAAVLGTVMMMTGTVSDGRELLCAPGLAALKYFTVDAGLLALLSAAVNALYLSAVLRGKRRSVPRWAEVLRLVSVTAVALTALTVAFLLAPAAKDGFSSLYLGANLIFHLILPVLAVTELFLRRGGAPLRFRANLFSLVPVAAYGLFYILPWLRAGADRTGYDWYALLDGSDPENAFVLLLLMLIVTFALSVFFWCMSRNFEREAFFAPRHRVGSDSTYYESVSATEYYQTRVIKLICVIAPAVAMCAAAIFTVLTLTEQFGMSSLRLIVFDACCLAYLPVALYIFDTCIGSDGLAIRSKVTLTKRLLTLLITLQWNLISYLAPFPGFWAYAFLFAAIPAMFLDSRMLLRNEILLFISMLLSWCLRGDVLLPARGSLFARDLILRLCAVLLSFTLLYVLVLLIEKILVRALDRISDYDPLTHTLTRRKLLRAVESALGTYNRIWVPCCIAIFDLDDFKKINDTYGHINGDEVLREFARIMYANIRSKDTVFRYGGEEFLILFNCPLNYAEASCERILSQLRENEFVFLPAGQKVTCTAGISVSARDMTAEEFIALADKRLYAGKRAGKDRVVSE